MKCEKCGKENLKTYYAGLCPTCYYTNTDVYTVCIICNKRIQIYSKKFNQCRKCYMDIFNKKNYENNKEKIKKQTYDYHINNKEKRLKYMKEYAVKNKETLKEYQKEYFDKNKEKLLVEHKKYYEENKKEIIQQQLKYKYTRLKTDIDYYIKDRLSARMRMAIMNHKGLKQTSAIDLLGADITTVRKHLEKLFKQGMSWKNHGDWHIDHIIPCDSFDLKDEKQQKICFHYSNLQPLWANDNIIKSNNIS